MKWFLRNERNKKILFLGDSITNDGRYADKIKYYFDTFAPEYGFEIIKNGLSSETLCGLSEPDHPFPRPCLFTRLSEALSSAKPDVVAFCYGMNDGIYYPFSEERFSLYKDAVQKLIDILSSENIQIVAMTPTPFDPRSNPELKTLDETAEKFSYMEPYENYDDVLSKYSEYIMSLEGDTRISCCVDLHTPLKKYIENMRSADAGYSFSDSIHPNEDGHDMMATIILKELVNVTLTAPVGKFENGTYHGFERKNFYFKGREASFILPEAFAEGRPWIWRGEFLGAFDSADVSMLEKGWGLAYINLSDMYGCDEALEIMHEFQLEAVKKFDLCEKTVLFGFSRGGLYSVNYGAKYPECVKGLYLDAPVVDIYSWPGGFGCGSSSPDSQVWKECKLLYNADESKPDSYLALLPAKLDTLLRNNIPIMYVAGGSDRVVPYFENGAHIVEEYLKRGGRIKIYIESWRDHHPHSLEQPKEIVRFLTEM